MPRFRSWTDIFNGHGFKRSLGGGLRYLFGKRGQRLVYGMRMYYRLKMTILVHTGKTPETWSRRREAKLWIDGEASFRRMETLIRKAKHHIAVQMFIWKSDETGTRIAQLLLAAADRGVNIDITKEAVGDFFEFYGDFISTKGSNVYPWNRFWNHPRIRISYGTHGDHAKVFAFDGRILLLTGMNLADEYRYRWHDYLVELRGAQYVQEFLTHAPGKDDEQDVRLVMNNGERKEIRPTVMSLLEQAKHSIVVEHCYIFDEAVVNTLIAASKRGVRVTVMMPMQTDFHHHANMLTIGRLLTEANNSNLRVFIYPRMSHAKAILIDYKTAFIGSANLYTESLDVMGEVNVLIRDKTRFTIKLQDSMRSNILKSRAANTLPSFLWISRWLAWLGL